MAGLRILHVLNHSLPNHDGYVFRTLAILRGQRALGHQTFHLTAPRHDGAQAQEEDIEGWHFYRTQHLPGAFGSVAGVGEFLEMRTTARRIAEVVEAVRPDLLHVHSPVLNALPALYVAAVKRLPVLYEVRALWEDGAVDHGTATTHSLRYRLSRAAESFALKRADAVTTICEGLRGEVMSRGVPAHKVTVIANAVDAGAFQLGAAPDLALRARLGLSDCMVIGYAGSFYAYEGVDLIIEAVASLAASMPKLRALLVGGGMQDAYLRRRAVELGVEDRVIFVGRVPNAEVKNYYDQIDFLVYPRRAMRLTELVTPLKPLEAMAQGRLVLASDVGGHRELIEDGVTGHLFRADDVEALATLLRRLASDPEGGEAMRLRARAYVENERTWQRSVANYQAVFARLLPKL